MRFYFILVLYQARDKPSNVIIEFRLRALSVYGVLHLESYRHGKDILYVVLLLLYVVFFFTEVTNPPHFACKESVK